MPNELKDLKERISKLSDEDLLKMAYINFDDYRKEAIDSAKEELERRGFVFDQTATEFKVTTPVGIKLTYSKKEPPSENEESPVEARAHGLSVAGYIFLLFAAIEFFSGVLNKSGGSTNSTSYWLPPFVDTTIGIGLLRPQGFFRWSQDSLRKWAIARVVLGAVVYGLVMPLWEQTFASAVSGVLQLLLSVGLLALLFNDLPISLASEAPTSLFGSDISSLDDAKTMIGIPRAGRIQLGILICIIALVGSVAAPIALRVYYSSAITKLALPVRRFTDDEAGFKLDVPEGWIVIPKSNPYMPTPNAKVVLAHPDTISFSSITVESIQPSSLGEYPVNGYLDHLLRKVASKVPNIKEISRTNVALGNSGGQRMVASWREDENLYFLFATVCQDGQRFYLLNDISSDDYFRAESVFKKLEKGFILIKSSKQMKS